MTDPGLIVDDGQGELVVADTSLRTPAWWTLDLSPLWGPSDLRGTNIIVPSLAGRRARPRRVDQTSYPLAFWITGAVDQDGDAHANPVMGLATNLDYLWEHVASPPDPPETTRQAQLTMPDGSMRTADVQVTLSVNEKVGPYDASAVLTVTVPAGRFEESGS